MKAAVYYENGGPEVLRYEEIPEPPCPPDGVLIEVEVVSLEGGDTLHRAAVPPPVRPHIVGYQCAGTIRELGPRVKGLSVGQRVVAVMPNGSHAERAVAAASSTWAVPEGADLEAVACVPVAFGTAHEALFGVGHLSRGERVLVHAGAGGVGLAAIQLAHGAGAEVLTTASSDGKLARLAELGVRHGINYRTAPLVEAVARAIGPQAVDLVIDTVGGKTLQDSVECLAYRGRIVSLGQAGRDRTPFQTMPLWRRNGALFGLYLLASLEHEHGHTYEVIAECIRRVAAGELRAIVARSFPLAQAAAAHAYVEGRAAFGRVVLRPGG